ncbi:MAG: 50S ribosomal protein L31e [Nanopusillaceae archaeon]
MSEGNNTQLLETQQVSQQNVQEVKEEKKENIEEYHVKLNIRKYILRSPINRRAKRAVKAIKDIVKLRFKAREVKLSIRLNNYIWSRGIRKPPTKYNIKIIKKDSVAYVDLDK